MVLSRRIRTAALAAGALTLTACSGSVLLPVGPYAPDPACGRIIQALPGELAFVSQSGALGGGILNILRDLNLGFAQFISIGNQADVDAGDALERP